MQTQLIAPVDAQPFDPVEFSLTLLYAQEMSQASSMICNPAEGQILIKDEGGQTCRFHLTDDPLNRFGFAVAQRYRDTPDKYHSFIYRWLALCDLIHSGALDGRYYRRAADAGQPDEIEDAVVELAASFPMSKRGEFDRRAFLAKLERSS